MRGKTIYGLGFTLIEMLIVVGIIAILAAIAVPNFLEAQTRSKVARVKSDLRTVAMAIETFRQANNSVPHCYIYCEKHQETEGRDAEWLSRAYALTTPVAYLSTTNWVDPFIRARQHQHLKDGDHTFLPVIFHYKPPEPVTTEPPTVITPGLIYTPYYESRNPTNSYMYAVFTTPERYEMVIRDSHGKEIRRPQYFLISVGPDGTSGPDFDNGEPWPALCYVDRYDGTDENRFVNWQYDPTNGAVSGGDIFRYEMRD